MNIDALIGKTLVSVTGEVGSDVIQFIDQSGKEYQMYHCQDCCESVTVEDICGDLMDLIGSPILQASEESSNINPEGVNPEYRQDSFTWTFYRLATMKGSVVIRWYGESNGYYSEEVDFCEVPA